MGPRAAWLGDKPRTLSDVSAKGAANTVMVVEVANAGIEWTEPRDLPLDALQAAGVGSPALAPSSYHGEQSGFFYTYDSPYPNAIVAMADGSVEFLRHVTTDHLPRILEIGGCTEEEIDSLPRDYEPPGRWNWSNITGLAVWLLSLGLLLARAVRSRRPTIVDSAPHGE